MTTTAIQLDAIDLHLLERLQVDASLNNQTLAELVHVSPPTCLRRVKRLLEAGLIEREIGFVLGAQRTLRLALKNPDFTTSRRIALAINDFIGVPCATPEDHATIRINLPRNFNGNIVDLITDIEQLVIETDQIAKIMSGNVLRVLRAAGRP